MAEEHAELKRVHDRVALAKDEYDRGRAKKWMYMGFCGVIGLVLGAVIPLAAMFLDQAVFSRTGIDGLL
jgi:hypothetical protein